MAEARSLGSVRYNGGSDPLGGMAQANAQAVNAAARRREEVERAVERAARKQELAVERAARKQELAAERAERAFNREADKQDRIDQKDLTDNSVTQFRWAIQQDVLSRDPKFFDSGQTEFTPQQAAARRATVMQSVDRMLSTGASGDAQRRMYIRRVAGLDSFAVALSRPGFVPIDDSEFDGVGSQRAREVSRLDALPLPSPAALLAGSSGRTSTTPRIVASGPSSRAAGGGRVLLGSGPSSRPDGGLRLATDPLAGRSTARGDAFSEMPSVTRARRAEQTRQDALARSSSAAVTPESNPFDKLGVVGMLARGAMDLYGTVTGDVRLPSGLGDVVRSFGGTATGAFGDLIGGAGDFVEMRVLAPTAIFTERNIADAEMLATQLGGGTDEEKRAALAQTERNFQSRSSRFRRIAEFGGGPVASFTEAIDNEITAWGDTVFDRNLLSDSAKGASARMNASLQEGDVGGALSAAWERPDQIVANMAGFVMGAGGPVRSLGKIAVTGAIALATGEDVSDSVTESLNKMDATTFSELPATRRMREKMPEASDEDLRAAVTTSQSEQARLLGMGGSLVGGLIGARSEMGLLAFGAVLKEARDVAVKRGIIPAIVRGGVVEATGEAVQGGAESLATGVGSAGIDLSEAGTRQITPALAQAAFEGILGGVIGGALGAAGVVREARGPAGPDAQADDLSGYANKVVARGQARSIVAQQLAEAARTDPEIADALTSADEAIVGMAAIEAAVEAADASAILNPEANHNRVADIAAAQRKITDNANVIPPAGSLRGADSGVAGDRGLALTPAEQAAWDAEVAADTAGTSVSDNPRADFEPQASLAAKTALHTADAYLNNARRAFTTGTEAPDPATAGRTNTFTAEPERQIDALIPVLQATGELPGLEVQAAQVLVAAGLGGSRGSVAKGRSTARRLAKLDPQMAGLVPAMDKIVSEYEAVRDARNRIKDATTPPEAYAKTGRKSKPIPADFDLEADTGVLENRLRAAGAPVVAQTRQIDRQASRAVSVADAAFSEADESGKATGKGGLRRRKTGESETAWQKRINALRRDDVSKTTQALAEPEHEPTRSLARQIIGMANDRSRILEAQAMAAEGQPEKAVYLAANSADVDEAAAAARHEVDRLRHEFEAKHLVPVVRAADAFDTHIGQTLGVNADTSRYIRESYALLTGVAGRARKKMYEVGYVHLTDASRLRVLDLATRQRNGLVTPDQFRGQMDAIFDDFASYDSEPPGVKFEQDETSEDFDADADAVPDSVLEQIKVDVSTEVAHARGRVDVVTIASAAENMAAIRDRLDAEGGARLDAYVAGLQESYAATFDFMEQRGLVDPAIAAYTEATGIKNSYIKHARANDETGKALDNDYRFDDPIEGDQVNFANTAYRSYIGKDNVPAIANLSQTLRKHLAGVAIRASEARVLTTAANLAQLPGGHSKMVEVREARAPVLDPQSGRWVYPDQPSITDTNLFLARDGARNRLITAKDQKLAGQLRSVVIDQDQKSYDDVFGAVAPVFRGLSATTRGLSRLMLISVGYIRTAAFRDLADNVSAAFTATANEPAGRAFKAVTYGVGTALMASPKTLRYAFSGEQARAKMAESFKDSASPIEQAIHDLHVGGVFPNLRQEFGDLGTGAERIDNLVKRDKRSAPVRGTVDTWNATTGLADKMLAMQDVMWRIVPYAAARQAGMNKKDALGVTEAVIRDAATRAARQTVDFTVRPEYNQTFWTLLRAVAPFAYSQNAGFVSNLRNMYRDGQVPPPEAGLRDHFEAIDKRKIAVATALGFASTQALITTTAAIGGVLAGGDSPDDEESWLSQQFSAREIMRNNPMMTALGVQVGPSQRDIDGDGNTDIGFASGPVGFSPLSFFSQVGAYAAMMANGVDREGATRAMAKAAVDSWSPFGVELIAGDVSQDSDAPFLWTMARNALGPLLGPLVGFGVNMDENGRPIVEETRDNPTGAKVGTPGAYGGFGGIMTPESQRYLVREFGGGPAQMLDQGLRDAETAAKHPELEGTMMRQLARFTWRGNEIDNVGRKYAENDVVFENLYTPMKERVALARAQDAAAGIKPTAVGPAQAAIARADPEAYAAYQTWGEYLGAKKELELRDYIPARQRGDSDTMGKVDVKVEELRREALAQVRKLHPDTFK